MRYLIFISLLFGTSAYAQTITRLEYYFDTDPGFGNGVSIPVTAAIDLTRDFTVPLNSVSEGFHQLYIRAKSNGIWSLPVSRLVMVQRTAQTASLFSIDRIEYFFDTDPGFGNGLSVPITSTIDLTKDFQLPLNTSAEGFHTIYFRARSSNGLWSTLLARPVFVQRNAQTTSTPTLRKIEYFLDTDPGAGNGTSVSLSASDINQSFSINLSTATLGFHILYVRSQDVNGRWSLPMAKPFFAGKSGSNIVALGYYYFDGATKSPVKVYSGFPPSKDVTIDFAAVLDGLLPNTSYEIHVTAINGDGLRSAETVHTFLTPAVICDPISPPNVIDANLCGNGSVDLMASGATGSQLYTWYQTLTEGIAIAGETDGLYTTPVLNDTTTYYVSIQNGTCESTRTAVTAFINPVPTTPVTINNFSCGLNTPVSLSASGGVNGQYRWYTVSTGGTVIPGEANSSFVTPPLSTSTTYFVSLYNGVCESLRTPVTATINAIPSQPVLTSSIVPVGNALTICSSTALTLSAPNGFATYTWTNGATTQQITISASGTYSVIVTDVAGCSSPASDVISVTVIPAPCNNQPPVIDTAPLSTIIGGSVTLNLLDLISDVDNNLVASSLSVVQQPGSGASATLVNGILTIDYSAVAFAGKDQLTIEVCDIFSACTQQILEIDVIGDIEIYNGISPNNDDQNDIFLIRYIDLLPDTQENNVTIYNRWGSKVFEVFDYNNTTNVFRGLNDNGGELPSGSYFYKIEFASGRESKTGFLSLKR
ncbi:MAG: gliding motility-associated C-terminal domain-containing protein [Cyclobacteriaceae bacterium]